MTDDHCTARPRGHTHQMIGWRGTHSAHAHLMPPAAWNDDHVARRLDHLSCAAHGQTTPMRTTDRHNTANNVIETSTHPSDQRITRTSMGDPARANRGNRRRSASMVASSKKEFTCRHQTRGALGALSALGAFGSCTATASQAPEPETRGNPHPTATAPFNRATVPGTVLCTARRDVGTGR